MAQSVVIIVPVYNEAGFLPTALPSLIEEVAGAGATTRVIIVENGSSDGTADVARQLVADSDSEVISLPEPDYGAAMREGFLAATGDWIVNFDIDYFSADFLHKVLDQPPDVDLVIGSKRAADSDDRRPIVRRLATRVFNLLLRTILGSGVSDTHGMKGFRSHVVTNLVPKVVSTKDLFDTELVVRAEREGYKIVEVPVTVEELRRAKSSLVRRAPRTIAGLIRIRKVLGGPSYE